MKSLLLIFCSFFFVQTIFADGGSVKDESRRQIVPKKSFHRTFVKPGQVQKNNPVPNPLNDRNSTIPKVPASGYGISKLQGSKAAKSPALTPSDLPSFPSITYNDLHSVYSSGILHCFYAPDTATFHMNVGINDTVNPQHWTMPNISSLKPDSLGHSISPSATPFAALYFPSSTLCLKYIYPDSEEFYEFYRMTQEVFTELGTVDIYYNQQDQKITEVDTLNITLTSFPLSLNTRLSGSYTEKHGDTTYDISENIRMAGFGTLSTPDGDLQVLKIYNNYHEECRVKGDLLYTYQAPEISFYCKDAHRLDLYLTEDSDSTGMVSITDLEYEKVTHPTGISDLRDMKPAQFFTPNPASGEIRFRKAGTYRIYNVYGMLIHTYENATTADVTDLPAGLYFVTDGNQFSQELIRCK